MKVTYAKEIAIRLVLNHDEAAWLRSVMQNYMGTGEESSEDYAMRKMFFDSLNGALRQGA